MITRGARKKGTTKQRRARGIHHQNTYRYCTAAWVEKYLWLKLKEDRESFIMCRLPKQDVDTTHSVRELSARQLSKDLHKFIAPVSKNLSSAAYGMHSLRWGCASAAINNGISERLVGKHGRWKLGYSRDRYLKDDKKGRLSVTKALGLWFTFSSFFLSLWYTTDTQNLLRNTCCIFVILQLGNIIVLSVGLGQKRKLRRIRRIKS